MKGTHIADLVEFLEQRGFVDYLPPEIRGCKPQQLNRSWLLAVSAVYLTPFGNDTFHAAKKMALEERMEIVLCSTNLLVDTLPEIATKLKVSSKVAGRQASSFTSLL